MKNIIETYQTYRLLKQSIIPGIQEYHTELKNIFLTFTEKRENILKITEDQTFEKDSETFYTAVKIFKSRLKTHLKTTINEAPDFEYKIKFLKKCEELNLTGLNLDKLYIKISNDLNTCKLYFQLLKITIHNII